MSLPTSSSSPYTTRGTTGAIFHGAGVTGGNCRSVGVTAIVHHSRCCVISLHHNAPSRSRILVEVGQSTHTVDLGLALLFGNFARTKEASSAELIEIGSTTSNGLCKSETACRARISGDKILKCAIVGLSTFYVTTYVVVVTRQCDVHR